MESVALRVIASGEVQVLRTNLAFDPQEDRRADERITVGLPVSVSFGTKTHTAKLVNITRQGAMLEVSVPLRLRSSVIVNCGSICADAVVVWSKGLVIGLSFKRPLSEHEVQEQISRRTALQVLRRRAGRS